MKKQWIVAMAVAGWMIGSLGKGSAEEAAPTPAPTAPPVKINGFLQAWMGAGNSPTTAPGHDYNLAGDYLKHFRIKIQAEPLPGVQVVMVPELAGAFTLLDGYAWLDLNQAFLKGEAPGELSLTAGQFKTPFGLDRMYLPSQLTGVEYSIISGAVFGDKSSWDDGLMATYKGKDLRVDLAVVKGLGPNLFTAAYAATTPLGLSTSNQDYLGRVEVPLFEGQLALGASYYYGTHFSTPGTQGFLAPKSWFGVHAKWKGAPKTYEVEAEFIGRETGTLSAGEAAGVNIQADAWAVPDLQPFVLYDYFENHLTPAASASRMGGGVNWYPRTLPALRLTLEVVGEGTGLVSADPSHLTSGKTILQTQVTF
ncbi:MAG TPA: hypothetical protein VHE12_11655 [bacterium]|nr:hypothetical protein [bacterium]